MNNINTIQWWEDYFGAGKWETHGGNDQTRFFAGVLLQNIQKDILSKIEKFSNSVCDMGCACGELTYLLQQSLPDCEVTGIDFSEAALEKAREQYPGIEFLQGDINSLKRRFDTIFISNVLEHFEDPYKILTKLLCLTEKYLVVMVPYREDNLDASHCYRFDENDFNQQYGCFDVIQRTVIDTSKMKNSMWGGEQMFVIFEKNAVSSQAYDEAEGTFAKPEVWDKVSEDYKIEIDESEYSLADEIITIFASGGVRPPAKILELGCGSGHLSACIAMKGYKVTLLDFSEGALAKAKETFRYYGIQGDFVKGDIFDLSNLKEQYDLVWNSGVMEHFSSNNLQKIYRSIMKNTKSKFIFLVPNPSSVSYLMMRYHLQGKGQWSYGMEYLRTDYLDIAQTAGFAGKVIGYAASSISKWHFTSTFPDSENTSMYPTMVDEGLMPADEAYLIAYELTRDVEVTAETDTKSADCADSNESKEKIFELSAIKFSLEKEGERKDRVINEYKEKEQALEDRLHVLADEKQLLLDEKLALENEKQALELQYLNEKNRLEQEGRELFEGVEFNRAEAERYRDINASILNMTVPRIKSETARLEEYLHAPGFSRLIRLHAVLGLFKKSGFKVRCKIIVKAMLRCVGVKKNFYTENERMDFKIRNCILNIDHTIGMVKDTMPEIVLNHQKPVSEDAICHAGCRSEIVVSSEPKISILLPVYNHAEFIRSAIEGVQKQTYKNWELIIINDGSTDNLLEILKDYTGDCRIRMYTQDNQRLPNTLTNLHNLATGQFVTWTSADNIMEPQMLEQLSKNLIAKPNAVMVFADVAIIDDKGEYLGYGYREMNRDEKNLSIIRLPHDTEALDVECDNYVNACFMYRMDAVKALKGQYSADLEGLEDYEFWLRLRTFGEIVHIKNKEPLYRYRVHANTMSEDLLKNKLDEHKKRSERMMNYCHAKDAYRLINWNLIFETENMELQHSLDAINYNYQEENGKTAYVTADNLKKEKGNNNLFVVEKEHVYEIDYLTSDGDVEKRAEVYKGIDISLLAKKVRQTRISGLFWEYPSRFANMQVIGCHMDLRKIAIDKTISFLNSNQDILFSFCATIGGQNKDAEQRILASCKNAVFMGEKELGTPVYLYASWNAAFIPPMCDMTDCELLPAVVCAWNIGRWIFVENSNVLKEVLPFVCTYFYDEPVLGIKKIDDLDSVESILDDYIGAYSKIGAARKVISYLNGIGQDLFVERPDFELIPKERKFPPTQLYQTNLLPEKLKKGYVAVVVDTLDKGGLEQVVAMLVKEFIARDMEIQVLCTGHGGLVAETLKEKGVIVKEFEGNTRKFEEYLTEHPPILVNTHYTKNMLGIIKARNIPMVEVIHNMYVFLDKDAWKAEREREKYFNQMIAVSELVKETYLKKHGSVNENKISVIGNCADVDKIYGTDRMFVRDELGIGSDSVVFINVSSMDGRKNQLGLMTAFDMYYRSVNQNSYLIMVGNYLSEFYNDAITSYMDELECKDHIIKLEYHRDVAALYNAADVFVMPSYYEGWSIAATEALYCGLPIIHSKCGSAIELVKDGQNGVLIANPAKDILTGSSEKLMQDLGNRVPENTEELFKAMSKMAGELGKWKLKRGLISAEAIQDFSKEKMIDSYITCFDECLQE